MLCLEAGRAVLCEKPIAINAAEAEELIGCARRRGRFLMEAMWTRFFPVTAKVRELLAAGAIGEPKFVQADFGFAARPNPESRLFSPELGGGALLDVGIYTLAWASMVFGGPPVHMASLADIGATGVDEMSAMVLSYGPGRMAALYCAVRAQTRHEAMISGTEGTIRVHEPFWRPSKMTLHAGGTEEVFEMPYEHNGYAFEAAAVMECLRAGKLECEVMPLDESLSIVRTMDALRAQWGLKYPSEG